MALSPIEIIALIFVLGGLVKIIAIMTSRKAWTDFVKGMYRSPGALLFVEVVLAAIVLYYLLQELNIVQITASLTLGALLTGIVFAVYKKEVLPPMLGILKKDSLKKSWLPILIWFILMVWTLIEIFY